MWCIVVINRGYTRLCKYTQRSQILTNDTISRLQFQESIGQDLGGMTFVVPYRDAEQAIRQFEAAQQAGHVVVVRTNQQYFL